MSDEERRISSADREVLRSAQTGEGLIPITSGEQLMAMARAAGETFDIFAEQAGHLVSMDRAAYVRALRVVEGYSWRAVAETCYVEWVGDWAPPSNQLMGMALCEAAARRYGEDYMREPWN